MSDTFEDKVKRRISNNKPLVIIGIILGGFIIFGNAFGAFRTLFPKKEPPVLEPINLEAVLIIDIG